MDMNTDLVKAILAAVRRQELSADEYRASTKHLIERLSDYDAREVGDMTEILVDRERWLKGRDYPPREGETFKYYVHLVLTLRGQDRLEELTAPARHVEVGLFDAL